jgi:hypothetical protein
MLLLRREDAVLRTLPLPVSARRMAILLIVVVAIDAAAALLIPNPRLWCALIPALIPALTPFAIFGRRAPAKS